MRKNAVIEKLSQWVWPWVRPLLAVSRRCDRCILSEKHGPLEGGLCQACRETVSSQSSANGFIASELSEKLDAALHEKLRNCSSLSRGAEGRSYDIALLLSGGKDSAYILHRLRTEHPDLRVLCIYVNNGFPSPVALSNAEHIAEKTGTDLILSHSAVPQFKRAFREAFLNLKGRGSSGVVDFADGWLIFETGKKIARDFGIRTVIGGLSWVQIQMIYGVDDIVVRDEHGTELLFPLAAWRTSESEIRRVVRERKLLPPGSESPIVSNNDLILAMSAIDVLNSGYCSFEPEFAQLVREGKTDRESWLYAFELLEFATTRGLLTQDIERALARLDLKLSDIVPTQRPAKLARSGAGGTR